MNKGVAIVGGVGLGAALMYIFDPDRGKRRRALIRDKVEATGNQVAEKVEKMGRDLGNRAYGIVAETKSMFRHDEVTDDVLVDRVRSRLGRIPTDIAGLDISVNEGTVTLKGQIPEDELPRVLRAVRFVRGVKAVDNQFQFQPQAGNDLDMQPQPIGSP